jgi:hypothetical protein
MKWTSILFLALVLFVPTDLQAEGLGPKNQPAPPPGPVASQNVPQLVIENDQFTLSPSCNPSEQLSFRLFSQGVSAKDLKVKVQVRDLKSPEGLSLPATAVKLDQGNGLVTPEGLLITLTLDTSAFLRPGAYKLTLHCEAEPPGAVQPLHKQLSLNRTVGAINLDTLKDQTFQLTRTFPGRSTSGKFRLALYETSTKAAIFNLSCFGQEIFREKTKIRVPGKVSVTPVTLPCLSPDNQLSLDLKISGIKKTGTFTTGVLLNSASFGSRIIIPLNLEVTDLWVWPFLFILAGVFGGYLVSYLGKKYKPRQENLLRITRIKADLDRLTVCTRDKGKMDKLYDFKSRLADAEDKNRREDFPGTIAVLEPLEKELAELIKQNYLEAGQTRRDVGGLKAQIKQYLQENLPNADKVMLNELLNNLEAAERHLDVEEVDQATELLKNCQAKFDEFRKKHLTAEVDAKEQEIRNIPAANQGPLQDQVTQIRKALDNNQLDQARQMLDSLDSQIDQIIQKAGGQRAILPMFKIFDSSQLVKEELAIHMLNTPENCTSGTIISFSLLPKDKLPADYDTAYWDFGDGSQTSEGKDVKDHMYRKSGTFRVQVRLLKGEQFVHEILSQGVEIFPGQAESSLEEIEKKVKFADYAILLTAIILAVVTGMLALYTGKQFGSLQDYFTAIIWGFGIDTGVRGFSGVFKAMTQ